MSVPKGDRGESQSEFVHTARELQIHTIRKCVNFPKRYSFYVSQPMAQMAGRVYEYAVCANSIYPSNQQDVRLRRKYLMMAHSECRSLVSQLEVAAELFGLRHDGSLYGEMQDAEARKMEYWTQLVWKEIRLLKGVMDSDARRYKGLPE